uniref:Uncharacterized protein n=1 Tax=Physcomitrium patens TaxID=3218 RepID=A0A7I4CQ22_PHYPA
MRCAQHNNFAHRLKLGENCDLVAMQTGRVACSLRVKCCQDLMVVECCCFRASIGYKLTGTYSSERP